MFKVSLLVFSLFTLFPVTDTNRESVSKLPQSVLERILRDGQNVGERERRKIWTNPLAAVFEVKSQPVEGERERDTRRGWIL